MLGLLDGGNVGRDGKQKIASRQSSFPGLPFRSCSNEIMTFRSLGMAGRQASREENTHAHTRTGFELAREIPL